MKKWESPNSFMWPFLDQLIWAALTPQGDLWSNDYQEQKLLEFSFSDGLIYNSVL